MKQAEQLQLFGEVSKTFGANGELIIKYREELSAQTLKKEPVFIYMDGLPVPFYFKSFEPKGTNKMLVVFEDMEAEALARELVGKSVFFVPKHGRKKRSDELNDLIGFHIIDEQHGELGTVTEVLDIPGNPCLSLNHQGKEVIIPLNEELVTRVDAKAKKIYLKLPEGLVDLYLE